jgi:hypothetical protein
MHETTTPIVDSEGDHERVPRVREQRDLMEDLGEVGPANGFGQRFALKTC